MKRIRIRFFLLVLLLSGLAAAQNSNYDDQYLQIKLITIGPGDELTMWWGHTALVVENTRTRKAQFYNYGLFSFEQENFMLNFARGRLIFWVGAMDAHYALAYYKSLDREIRSQTLNLPPEKKVHLAKVLEENILPENREYLYDHFFDNCATRIRDLIDAEVDGQLKRFTDKPAEMTLRDHTRRFTHDHFFMDWLLMFLMNDTIDQPITQWDEMFLPDQLEKYFDAFSYTDSSGAQIPLVSEGRIIYESETINPIRTDAPLHWPWALLIGLLFAVMARYAATEYLESRFLLGLFLICFGVLFGFPGTVLFLMSLLTDHVVTFYNENLFIANPLTFALLYTGIAVWKRSKHMKRWLWLIYVQALLALAAVVLKVMPQFDQFNWLSISLIVPSELVLAWYMFQNRRIGAKVKKSKG